VPSARRAKDGSEVATSFRISLLACAIDALHERLPRRGYGGNSTTNVEAMFSMSCRTRKDAEEKRGSHLENGILINELWSSTFVFGKRRGRDAEAGSFFHLWPLDGGDERPPA
jgi:hypothetical protein